MDPPQAEGPGDLAFVPPATDRDQQGQVAHIMEDVPAQTKGRAIAGGNRGTRNGQKGILRPLTGQIQKRGAHHSRTRDTLTRTREDDTRHAQNRHDITIVTLNNPHARPPQYKMTRTDPVAVNNKTQTQHTSNVN